jgi:alanine racemase
MGRTAIALLSTENLLHNLQIIKSYAPQSGVVAMVKANAYGHGLRSTALRLDDHVAGFGVASIDEALALRKVGIKASVILMEGVFEPEEINIAAHEKFEVVIHNDEQLKWLKKAQLSSLLKVWLKVDTGMGRLGFKINDAHEALYVLQGCEVIKPVGIMSHLACADQAEHEQNRLQIKNFTDFIQNLPGPKSLCNSAAVFNFSAHCYDMMRPGLALYGVSPLLNSLGADLKLKPVMTLQTSLIAVRHEKEGSLIGYGGDYRCSRDMPVGIMAMGYGDGYPQKNPHQTPVLVNDSRCHVIGRVSMDMAAIDLSACPQARVGDVVTLWGAKLPLEEIAQHTKRTPYDLLCAVQSRVKFFWS